MVGLGTTGVNSSTRVKYINRSARSSPGDRSKVSLLGEMQYLNEIKDENEIINEYLGSCDLRGLD